MPLRDPAVYLEDIEHHAEAAMRFMDGCSLEQYLADDKTRAAVERMLEICGEALKQLLQVDAELGQQIPTPATSSASGTSWPTATRVSTMHSSMAW